MGKISSSLFKFSDKIFNFAQKFENIPNKTPEIAVLVLYPILFIVFSFYHEPWYDEAQAWQIAKCATYRDILLYLPHFEGHPPFWHLILSIFAKNNFPYEITIKTISFVFSYLALFLLIFKAPFFRIIKILLPFTYFLFYHYAIISRPYCMVMLAFCLLAINYKKKSIKYALSLVFLAMCHAYTFIISSFLALIWFVEEIKKKSLKNILLFFGLAVFYLSTAYILIPSKEALAMNESIQNTFFEKLLYTFFAIPSDSLFTFINTGLHIRSYELISGIFGGLFIFGFLYFYTKKSKLYLTFFVPYIPFSIFATKYFYLHHSGIIFCFIVFIAWLETVKRKKTETVSKNEKTVNKCFTLFVFIVMFSNLYLSFKSCILDVFYTYSIGRNEANFIKEHKLNNYKIMVEWPYEEEYENPNIDGIWLSVAPYFEKNIFYNFSIKNPEKNYILSKISSKKENEEIFSLWEKVGPPDVIAGRANVEKFFGKNISDNYIIVYSNNYSYIHKGIPLFAETSNIRVEKELAKKLNLKEVTPKEVSHKVDLFRITTYIVCKIFDFKNDFLENKK